MTIARLISIAALGVALNACTAGQPGLFQPYSSGPKSPPPVAFPGEPEVIVGPKSPYTGRPTFSQEFPSAGTIAVPEIDANIAALYYAMDGDLRDIPAQTMEVSCVITDVGTVPLSGCYLAGEGTDDQRRALAIARLYGQLPDLPRYSERRGTELPLSRRVPITLELPAITAPQIDLSAGPLVDAKLVKIEVSPRMGVNGYPSRALRQNVEGILDVECQVQIDLSVICTAKSFDPPEHLALFASSAREIYRGRKAAELLTDGSDAKLVRWMRRVRFTIPQ